MKTSTERMIAKKDGPIFRREFIGVVPYDGRRTSAL
jgi:hypothetical protein